MDARQPSFSFWRIADCFEGGFGPLHHDGGSKPALKRLKTIGIDSIQLTAPVRREPIEETLRCAFDDLVHQVRVRYIGCSNLAAGRSSRRSGHRGDRNLEAFIFVPGRVQPAGPRHRARADPAMASCGLGSCPIPARQRPSSPASTSATRRSPDGARLSYIAEPADRYMTEAKLARRRASRRLCRRARPQPARAGLRVAGVAASRVELIAGATKPEQVEADVRAVDWTLTRRILVEIDGITRKA